MEAPALVIVSPSVHECLEAEVIASSERANDALIK